MTASYGSSSESPVDCESVAKAEATENDLDLSPDAPWLGLRSFTESSRDYFYGRDVEIQALFDRVQHRTLTVLFGQSGLGKTSLLQAGLIPRLREAGFIPILIRLVHDEAATSLQQQVVQTIAEAIPSVDLGQSAQPTLWELFHDRRFGLTKAAHPPVLIIDQFEEIFTLGEEKRPADGREFLNALACLVENRPPAVIRALMDQDSELAARIVLGSQPCKVLLALRDDFLSRLERARQQMPSMMDNRFELRLLSGQQAFRAVYEPGTKRTANPIVSRETARSIVRFVAGATADTPLEEIENVPPLLSLICEQLNARRLDRGEPSINAGSLTQSAPEVLREFYNDCFAPHPAAVREFVEDQLVSASGFRESKTLDTAMSILTEAAVPQPVVVLRKLVDQRLLVVEDRGGVYRVELTHDILSPIAAAARKDRAAMKRRLAAWQKRRRTLAATALFLTVVAVTGMVIRDKFDQQGKEIHAQELVQSLVTTKTPHVPDKINEMSRIRRWVEPLLRTQNNSKAVTYHFKLHASLARFALLPADLTEADYLYLFDRLLDYDSEPAAEPLEFPVIRDALSDRKNELREKLWAVTESIDKDQATQRLRAASALAAYDPESPRWTKVTKVIAMDLVAAPTAYVSLWMALLRPVGAKLIDPLCEIFRSSTRELERSIASNLLADYAADQPTVLTRLVLDADQNQFGVIYRKFEKYRENELPALVEVVGQKFAEDLSEDDKENIAKRQANAAVILLKMQKPDDVWPLLQYSEDPRTRSYLIHRLVSLGVEPQSVIARLKGETDITIQRALLLCLGEFDRETIPLNQREDLLSIFQQLHLNDTDPGIHAASEWVLRQWKEEAWLKQVNEAWAQDDESRKEHLELINTLLADRETKASPRWYVNSQGQTMVVIPGAVEFKMGSPETEVAREDDEEHHRRRIDRTFAVAATPVTMAQYRQFDGGYEPALPKSARPENFADSPAVRINWYEAALFCNWLSEREGIPESQWCYVTRESEDGEKYVVSLSNNYLGLSGYRLPTEAEMECVTRAGAITTRFYGETDELLSKYAWFAGNSQRRLQRVGCLKPNDLGLFDVHGNANTWCQETFRGYPEEGIAVITDDTEDSLEIMPKEPRSFRGGSYKDDASLVRSAYRNTILPNESYPYLGFRLARTLGTSQPAQ